MNTPPSSSPARSFSLPSCSSHHRHSHLLLLPGSSALRVRCGKQQVQEPVAAVAKSKVTRLTFQSHDVDCSSCRSSSCQARSVERLLYLRVADTVPVNLNQSLDAHSLHLLLRRLWWQMPAPPHTLHAYLLRLCSHIADPSHSLHWLLTPGKSQAGLEGSSPRINN